MPTAKKAPATPQVPASPPVRVEIRVGGRVKFAQDCFVPELAITKDGAAVTFSASLQAVLVNAPVTTRAPERFGDDIRDGEEVIQQVHSGRRT